MSYCPRPDTTAKTNYGTSATKTVNAPGPRGESCAPVSSSVVTGGGSSSSNTVYVPGPAGPMGPPGANGTDGVIGANGLGFKYRGEWTTGFQYKKEDGQTNPLADVVVYDGQAWVCVQDNLSTEGVPDIVMSPGAPIVDWSTVSAGGSNAGDGVIATIEVTDYRMYKPGSFTVEFTSEDEFDVSYEGTVIGSGSVSAYPEFNKGGLKITLVEGGTPWAVGDTFSFETVYGIDSNSSNVGNGKVVDIILNSGSAQGQYTITLLDAAQFTFEGETGEVGTPFYHAGVDVTFTVQAGSIDFDTDDFFDINISEVPVPQLNEPYFKPEEGSEYWELFAAKGTNGMNAKDKTFLDKVGDVYDWIKNASVTQLVNAGIAAVGIITAGAIIADMISDDGSGDGEADQRFNGTPGYPLTSFTNPDIKEVLQSLCDIEGIACDVSAIPDQECAFAMVNANIRSVLGQLSLAYLFEMVDTGGVLRFVPRSASSVKVIDINDLGVDEFSANSMPVPWTAKRVNGINLPKSVSITYNSPDLDHNKFTQTASYVTFDEGQEISLSVPFSLKHDQAQKIAELSLIQSHLESHSYTFSTTYKHIDLEPGDIVDAPMGLVRITSVEEQKEGVLFFTAVDAGSVESLLGSDNQVVVPPALTNVPTVIGYSQGLFIDPPNLSPADQTIRMMVAVHGYDAPGWPGAQIYLSENGGSSYEPIATTYRESTVGLVASAVPAADWHCWDETTVITVQVKTNTLLSCSKLDVLNGKNWCMIGKEVIGFRSATLISPKTYQLSGLLRGRQGTEQQVDKHVANELFVVLDDSIVKIPFDAADRGTTKKYKIVTIGSSVDKATAQDVQMFSTNTIPWAVYNGKCVKSGNDFIVSWEESVRYDNQIRDLTTQQHDPNWGGYGIYIYNGSTIIKTYTTTSTSWTYTNTMQVEDFGSVRSSLKVGVAQLDTKYGAGYAVTLNS